MLDTVDVLDLVPEGSEAHAGCFLARDYHGGQFTELYKLSSSGKVDSLWYLARELREAIAIAESDAPEDIDDLTALLAWVEAQPDEEDAS